MEKTPNESNKKKKPTDSNKKVSKKGNSNIEKDEPTIASMSLCKIDKNGGIVGATKDIYDLEVILVLEGFTAQFVTDEQFKYLMFILGQKTSSSDDFQQAYFEVLKVFQGFPTNSVENFKYMMKQLQFPFIYDDSKTIGQNRHDFKDFFSCLTNIRCAIVEGAHCCEAAN